MNNSCATYPQTKNANQLFSKVILALDHPKSSLNAFFHGLKMARCNNAHLYMVHTFNRPDSPSFEFPHPINTLKSWSAYNPIHQENKLPYTKVLASGKDATAPLFDLIDGCRDNSLLVMSPNFNPGLRRCFFESPSTRIAYTAKVPTLFVPKGTRGFVDEGGNVGIERLFFPVIESGVPEKSIGYAEELSQILGGKAKQAFMFQVGHGLENVDLPTQTSWHWQRLTAKGSPAQAILEHAKASEASLIVMRSRRKALPLNPLRRGTVETVIRKSSCPVLLLHDA